MKTVSNSGVKPGLRLPVNNEGLVEKLSETRECLAVLKGMLESERRMAEQEAGLITQAKQCVDGILYELTGNNFYRKGNNDENN